MRAPIRRSSVLASLLAVTLTGALAAADTLPSGAVPTTQSSSDERGYLGINMTVEDGAMVVQRVLAASPAEQAGLRPGDRITRIGEHRIADEQALGRHLASLRIGQTVTIRVERDGWSRDLEVVLAAPTDVWTEDAPRQRADRGDESETFEVIETPMDVDVFKRADGADTGSHESKVEILFGEQPTDQEASQDADAEGEARVRVRGLEKDEGARKDKRVEVLEALGQSDEYDDVRSRVRAGTLRQLGGAGAADIQALREEVRALRRDVDALLEMRAELRQLIETLQSRRGGAR